ncbi:tetratricopeptide repeat protein [Candidatus Bathyarchaeota archaeon]|nr:tetratricopeptide repeat protein [Candidatus Bathyarchaeota archaeon]
MRNIAYIQWKLGNRDVAIDALKECLQIDEKVGDLRHSCDALVLLAEILEESEKEHEALAIYKKALHICEKLKDPRFSRKVREGIQRTMR